MENPASGPAVPARRRPLSRRFGGFLSRGWRLISFGGGPAPSEHAPAESETGWSATVQLRLRRNDRFEQILREALILEISQTATEFAFDEEADRLGESGFLTEADRMEWADCLAVQNSLSPVDASRAPSILEVEATLARMLRLQVLLADRRRQLFARQMRIREAENAALRAAVGRIG